MKTITSLGRDRMIKHSWDEDPAVFGKWRTKPVWLQAVDDQAKKIHLTGLGDVGMNAALGLVLRGAGAVDRIGLYDLRREQCERLATELSQVAGPPGSENLPSVRVIADEDLFDCDIFLFCATKSVPVVGSGVKDVRMAQYEANRRILGVYAAEAAKREYKGLFVVVSDPVDLLCMEALRASAKWSANEHSGRPLTTDQILGCGLGVMHARASYYAARNPEWSLYLKEGRAFGPHGEGLVIADSMDPRHYRDESSRMLTEKTIRANMEVRELGFKPYIAPAMSSAVLTLLAVIRGEWNYSAAYLNGLYFGALNRQGPERIEWEETELPDQLYTRLEESHRHLEEIIWD